MTVDIVLLTTVGTLFFGLVLVPENVEIATASSYRSQDPPLHECLAYRFGTHRNTRIATQFRALRCSGLTSSSPHGGSNLRFNQTLGRALQLSIPYSINNIIDDNSDYIQYLNEAPVLDAVISIEIRYLSAMDRLHILRAFETNQVNVMVNGEPLIDLLIYDAERCPSISISEQLRSCVLYVQARHALVNKSGRITLNLSNLDLPVSIEQFQMRLPWRRNHPTYLPE